MSAEQLQAPNNVDWGKGETVKRILTAVPNKMRKLLGQDVAVVPGRKQEIPKLEELKDVDLPSAFQANRRRVEREKRFRLALKKALKTGVAGLRRYAFDDHKPADFNDKELMEISNRFRLFGEPGDIDEVRLYTESNNAEFRATPRVREFYAFALIKTKESGQAIKELQSMVQDGMGNSLVFGALGDAFTDVSISAEKFAKAMEQAEASGEKVDQKSIDLFRANFGINPVDGLTGSEQEFTKTFLAIPPRTSVEVYELAVKCLKFAEENYKRGFAANPNSFASLGLLRRANDRRAVLAEEKARGNAGAAPELLEVEKLMEDLMAKSEVITNAEGGNEALDYWTHASRLELVIVKGDEAAVPGILKKMFKTVDAMGKLINTTNRLNRVQQAMEREIVARRALGEDVTALEKRVVLLKQAKGAIKEFEPLRTKADKLESKKTADMLTKDEEATLGELQRQIKEKTAEVPPSSPLERFREKTFNFLGLVDSTVPQYIQGGIGRVGARVPDIINNREDSANARSINKRLGIVSQEDTKALASLEGYEMTDAINKRMRDGLTLIQKFVRTQFNTASLQDLKSIDHEKFDQLSDGLIRLSGINSTKENNRKDRVGTRSVTNLTAALLAGLGDCRETMVGVGLLFATFNRALVNDALMNAESARRTGDEKLYKTIMEELIPEFLRYNVRGGQVSIYSSIEMNGMYDAKRKNDRDPSAKKEDPTALERQLFGGTNRDLEAARLTQYETENAVLNVTYNDGRVLLLEAPWEKYKDGDSDKWRPQWKAGELPPIPDAGKNWENIQSVEIRNKVEEHALTFLEIESRRGEPTKVELADGFYNHGQDFRELGDDPRYVSPYEFGSGELDLNAAEKQNGMIRAGNRVAIGLNGEETKMPVYIRFLPFSKTDYQKSLGEGDRPGKMRLYGNTIAVDNAVDPLFARMDESNMGKKDTVQEGLDGVREWHLKT